MRRLGGLIVALALAVTGCGTSGDNVTTRSSTSAPTTQLAPTTPVTAGDSTTTSPPGADGAPDTAATAPEADDPVFAGVADTVRQPAAPAPTAPSGPQPTGHIEIPAIGLSHTTYEGIDLAIINYGPSHWPGTAWPGHKGNTVFPGHRTTYSRPFWDIDHLAPGDEVIFTTREGRFVYRVTETLIVSQHDNWIVEPTKNATFTIFGCHPKGSARQRYVAKGKLVSPLAAPPTTTTTTTTAPPTTTTTEPEDEGLLGGLFG